MKLENKAFVITGGCGAIGGGAAKAILARGGIVVVLDVLESAAGEAKVRTYHPDRAYYFQTDIADVDKVSAALDLALKVIPKGSLFGGVHCAAIAPARPWTNKMKDSCADFSKVLKVNAYGTFVVDACIADAINSQYPDEGPYAVRVSEERGCIVNIASMVARPVPGRCLTYGPSKTCVLGISSAASDYLGPSAIRVNTVSPSIVASALMGDRTAYFEAEVEAAAIYPRRFAVVDEVVSAIVYLLENSMMNDFDFRIDGGWRGGTNWAAEKDPRSNAPALE
ncbi:hypothetical protein BCR39DRAFT_494785 [Naematelia encephala]|uniref:3-hydroxyacyl-CoA dehydrogenase n=1 Tax=Naematelia encephala TaxID=71784 RepID=A0A1Y2B5R3_9TREE|nr:hypothetical protein BCR39DRAFT_494785 [Naematelia encephala]